VSLRHREQDLRYLKIGTYVSPIGPTTFYRSATDGFRRICDDSIGDHHTPYDLSLMETFQFFPTLDCTGNNRSWTACPVGYQPALPDPRTKWPALTALDRNNRAWEILAQTNPSVPHVSVPTFVGELKDLPGLVKGYGDGLLKSVANGYLSWRWAIKPMISDLQKLWNFQKAVDDRVLWLKRLSEGNTLRRKVRLGTTHATDAPAVNQIVHSEGCTIRGTFQALYSMKEWGSAQWKLLPNSLLPRAGDAELRKKALALTFGITGHEILATFWELQPWSWLADWFGNTGDIIAATNNTVGCTWHNVCYMRTSEAIRECTYNPALSDSFALAGLKNLRYVMRMVRKERYVCVPLLPFPFPSLPILTSGQWSILAALAAQRR
jgi:hypothetical protein